MLRLLDDDCGYRLVTGKERGELVFDVAITRWWESESPGGSRRLDRSTGLEVTGVVVSVEIGYEAAIRPAEGGKPLATKSRVVRRGGSTQRNPKWDPRARSLASAFDALAKDVGKIGCRVARKRAASRTDRSGDSR